MRGWLQHAGLTAESAEQRAAALAAVGLDSVQALRAVPPPTAELQAHGATAAEAALVLAALGDSNSSAGLTSWLEGVGVAAEQAAAYASALSADGYDSYTALEVSGLDAASLQGSYAMSTADASSVLGALAKLKLAPPPPGGAAAARKPIDPKAVPLDDMLIDCLIKLAGGVKKGTEYPTHMGIAELRAKMTERMTPFHKVTRPLQEPLQEPLHDHHTTLPHGGMHCMNPGLQHDRSTTVPRPFHDPSHGCPHGCLLDAARAQRWRWRARRRSSARAHSS